MKRLDPRRTVAVICALLFFYGFYLGTLQLVIRDISLHFGMEISGIGVLVAVPHITSLLLPPLMGTAADRFGKKPVLLCFAGILFLGCLLCGSCGGVGVYVVGALLIGGGCSVCETVGSAALCDLSEENAQRYINLSQCLLSAGAVLGPILISLLLPYLPFGWRTPYFLCAGAFLLMLPLLATTAFAPAREKRPAAKSRPARLLASPLLLCAMLSMAFYLSLENGVGYFTESFFATSLQREGLSPYAISLYWIGMTVSRLVLGLWKQTPHRVLRLCFGASALLFVLLLICRQAAVCLVLCFFIGFAFGPIWGTLAALGATAFPEHSAKATGLISAFGSVGSTLAPVFMGIAADRWDIRAVFVLMALFALGGLALSCLYRKKARTCNT